MSWGQLAAMAIVLSVFLITSLIAVMYDGGLVCFLAPKQCSFNQLAEPVELTPVSQPFKDKETDVILVPTLHATPTQWMTPTPNQTPSPDPSQSLPVALERSQRGEVDCGPNPYRYNDIAGNWERRFIEVCYGVTGDPFEAIFGGWNEHDGLNYDEVYYVLELLGVEDKSDGAQLARMISLDLWNPDCECVQADLNEVLANRVIILTSTPEPIATETDK